MADFDKALELAVTLEEEDAIFAAQKVWASEEARRVKWFKCVLVPADRPPAPPLKQRAWKRLCVRRVYVCCPLGFALVPLRPLDTLAHRHYLDSSNLKEAAKLVVTPLEEARLIRAQARRTALPQVAAPRRRRLLPHSARPPPERRPSP